MLIVKPDFYDSFKCTADKCEDDCCSGWQIVIDDDALSFYQNHHGQMKERFERDIDYKEGCFKQNGRRCAFLNSSGLCDIQATLGEEALCRTCRVYPRHTEEYEDIRELSLSLSCPVAAEMMLTKRDTWSFIETENDEEDDFEDFDFLLYDRLQEARKLIYKIIQNRSIPLADRMKLILSLAHTLQDILDNDDIMDMDELIDNWNVSLPDATSLSTDLDDASVCRNLFSGLYEMENLYPDWPRILDEVWDKFYDCRIDPFITRHAFSPDGELALEQVLMFFIYTYFCGSVYDDCIYSKAALSVFSVFWIYEISKSHSYHENELKNLIISAKNYAREVEHSDINLNLLEDIINDVCL